MITISSDDITTFHDDGMVVLRGVISAQWLIELSSAIEADIANPGPFYHGYEPEDGSGRFHGNLRTWEVHDPMRQFCLESDAPQIARQILGSNRINLLYDQLFVKEPGTRNPTRWHNDQPYWPIDGRQVLTIWVALDEVDQRSGALEFIAGSHLWNRQFQPEVFGKTQTEPYEINPDYEPMIDVDADRDQYRIVTADLAAGDVYVFHGLTVHGAGGNLSNSRRRRGYAVRYTGDDVTYSTRAGTNKGLRNAELSEGDRLDSDRYPAIPLPITD